MRPKLSYMKYRVMAAGWRAVTETEAVEIKGSGPVCPDAAPPPEPPKPWVRNAASDGIGGECAKPSESPPRGAHFR